MVFAFGCQNPTTHAMSCQEGEPHNLELGAISGMTVTLLSLLVLLEGGGAFG